MVSVVIPSLRGNADLLELVTQLQDGDVGPQVLIADNGLSPGVVGQLRAQGASVIAMGANRGFAAAVNAAATWAEGEILVVLNDDLAVEPGFLDALVRPVRTGATMAAGVLLNGTMPDVIETAGIEIDSTLGAHDYLRGEPITLLEHELPAPVAPCGGAAAYRLDAFRQIGGFDEGFFAYFEDLDLALRLRADGGSCAIARDARAEHAGSATLGAGSPEKAALVAFSRGYVLRKYGVLSNPVTASLALAQEAAAAALLIARHHSLAPAAARVRGWRTCPVRARKPAAQAITVGAGEAWRRRYRRASAARPRPWQTAG